MRGLLAHVIHQVVHVQDVAAGKHARDAGHELVVHERAARDGVYAHARLAAELVFRQQPHGEQQRVARVAHLRAGYGAQVLVHLGDGDRLHAALALHVHHGVRQLERYAKVIQALHDVALEPAGVRHELRDARHVRALEREPARHDEADVAGAQDHDLAPRQQAVDVYQALRGAGRVHAGRARAADVQRAARPLAAAHRKHHGPRAHAEDAALCADGRHHALWGHVEHRGLEHALDAALARLRHVAGRVLRARELLLERVEAKAVVDALVEDAAQLRLALQHQHGGDAGVMRGNGGGKARGSPAHDHDVARQLWHGIGRGGVLLAHAGPCAGHGARCCASHGARLPPPACRGPRPCASPARTS